MSVRVEPDRESLQRLLKEFRELPPKVRTRTRRQLRGVGDEVIAEQRAILDGPLPRGVRVAGRFNVRVRNAKTGKVGMRRLNLYKTTEVKQPGRSTGMRARIKAGLVTRVVTGETRQSIEVRTQSKKAPMSSGWNSRRFRHPVFKTGRWAHQQGQPYFWAPVFRGRDRMLEKATEIMNDVIDKG